MMGLMPMQTVSQWPLHELRLAVLQCEVFLEF